MTTMPALRRGLIPTFGPVARKMISLSGLTAMGQLTFVLATPLLSRLFTPEDFGIFIIYLSIVNICGPIVGLKFESGLYAVESRDHARQTLALSIVTMAIMTLLAIGLVLLTSDHLPGSFGKAAARFGLLVPFGILLAGLWGSTSAWAIKADAIPTLAVARFVQPTAMTVLQLAAGLAHLPGISMVIAHLISHIGYASYILACSLTAEDWHGLCSFKLRLLLNGAREHKKFPLFIMPAQVGALTVSNLPPILIGLIFGTDVAGHWGLAYRLIGAPITIISMPLGHVFTSEVSRDRSATHVRALGRKILLSSIVLVAIPLLLLGSVAPGLSGLLLGPHWVLTGQIASALAILGAAQAIATPFSELTSIYRFQALRFFIEISSAVLVFTPLVIAAFDGWHLLPTVWMMSIAGAIGSLAGFILVWLALGTSFREQRILSLDT